MNLKQIIPAAAVAVLMLSASQSWAQSWRKVAFTSQQGATINVDTQITKPAYPGYTRFSNNTASPLYVNVRHPSLTPNSTVRVVLNNHNLLGAGSLPQTYVLDLKPSMSAQYGFHFSGEIGDATVTQGPYNYGTGKQKPLVSGTSGSTGNAPYNQDVAVVANGTWQRDPISQTNNFGMQLGLAQP